MRTTNTSSNRHPGKLSNVLLHSAASTPWPQSVDVTYTGGFDLPDEAPLPLKQATAILIREERMRNQQAQVAGIRQVTSQVKPHRLL